MSLISSITILLLSALSLSHISISGSDESVSPCTCCRKITNIIIFNKEAYMVQREFLFLGLFGLHDDFCRNILLYGTHTCGYIRTILFSLQYTILEFWLLLEQGCLQGDHVTIGVTEFLERFFF